MKAVLVIDMPKDCGYCPCIHDELWMCQADTEHREGGYSSVPSWCPLKHPLKYASNDFYIYDTKYLMENLDREINLLKGTKAFEEIMEKQNESNISG